MSRDDKRLSDILLRAKGKVQPSPPQPSTLRPAVVPIRAGASQSSATVKSGDVSNTQKGSAIPTAKGGLDMSNGDNQRESKGNYGKPRSIGHWTGEEHNAFLQVISKDGWCWPEVCAAVPNRTPAQVRSHAQKYFARLCRDKALPPSAHPRPFKLRSGEVSPKTNESNPKPNEDIEIGGSPAEPRKTSLAAEQAASSLKEERDVNGNNSKRLSDTCSRQPLSGKRNQPEQALRSQPLAEAEVYENPELCSYPPLISSEVARSYLFSSGRSILGRELDSFLDGPSLLFGLPDQDRDGSPPEDGFFAGADEASFRFCPTNKHSLPLK